MLRAVEKVNCGYTFIHNFFFIFFLFFSADSSFSDLHIYEDYSENDNLNGYQGFALNNIVGINL